MAPYTPQIETIPESDSLYLHISNHAIVSSVELSPDIIIDIDEDNKVVGIDFQHVSVVVKETRRVSASAPVELQVLVPA